MKAKTYYVDGIDATTPTVYYTTPPNTRAKVIFLSVKRDTGAGSKTIEVFVNDGTTDYPIVRESLSSGNSKAEISYSQTSYILLETGYTIKAEASATDCQLVFTVEETPFLVSTA